ncbi:hypothetical protein V2J94_35905 [Streptomyces sp. DSM 41524]|uniref:Uncharacterized protein n=1 Tax=Streptomyces asiaticus subsp. ignotus TaxID=3098222 RepID=A0ABU7Q729_9ACTN|nr:hypothetical protein [Streptomyces sp. DSM 41524]
MATTVALPTDAFTGQLLRCAAVAAAGHWPGDHNDEPGVGVDDLHGGGTEVRTRRRDARGGLRISAGNRPATAAG